MTAQVGINAFGAPTYTLIDNATVVGKAGSESSTTQPFSAAPAVGQWNLGLTRTKWWRTAAAFGSGNVRVGVYRKCETSRSVTSALVAVKNRLIPATEDSTVGTTAFGVFVAWASATLPGQVEDIVIAWNDIRSLRGRAVSFGYLPAATAGTPNQSIRRQAFIGNVCERIGTDPTPIYSIGEDVSATMSYNIIEGNTFVGDRTNTFYSDPVPTTVAETNSQLNQAFVNRVANNAFDWLPTKHDAFNDSSTASVRGNGNGYRPQMVEAWSMTYGVCHEANVDTQRATAAVPGLFALEYSGARTLTGYGGALAPLYSSDQSLLGTGTGGGNYRPQPASPLAGRALRGNADVDADGQTRRLPFAAGALQAVVVDLAPAGARSAQLAAASQANWSASLVPNRSRHALTGTTQVNWSAALIPVAARHGLGSFVGQGAQLSWAGAIAPGASRHACASGSASVAWTVTLAAMDAGSAHRAQLVDLAVDFTLAAVASAHASGSTMPGLITVGVAAIPVDGSFLPLGASSPLLLTGAAVPAAMLIVGPDPRTLIPNRN
jgi:hypothetical protein